MDREESENRKQLGPVQVVVERHSKASSCTGLLCFTVTVAILCCCFYVTLGFRAEVDALTAQVKQLRQDFELQKKQCDLLQSRRLVAGSQRPLDESPRPLEFLTHDVAEYNQGEEVEEVAVEDQQQQEDSNRGKASTKNQSLLLTKLAQQYSSFGVSETEGRDENSVAVAQNVGNKRLSRRKRGVQLPDSANDDHMLFDSFFPEYRQKRNTSDRSNGKKGRKKNKTSKTSKSSKSKKVRHRGGVKAVHLIPEEFWTEVELIGRNGNVLNAGDQHRRQNVTEAFEKHRAENITQAVGTYGRIKQGDMLTTGGKYEGSGVYHYWKFDVSENVKKEHIEKSFGFDVETGKLTVKKEGLYLIYAQIRFFTVARDRSFRVRMTDASHEDDNSETLFQCISIAAEARGVNVPSPTDSTCYTAGIHYLNANSSLWIDDPFVVESRGREIGRDIRLDKSSTFWGFLKL